MPEDPGSNPSGDRKCLHYIWRPRWDLGYLWWVREIVSRGIGTLEESGTTLKKEWHNVVVFVIWYSQQLALASCLTFQLDQQIAGLSCHRTQVQTQQRYKMNLQKYTPPPTFKVPSFSLKRNVVLKDLLLSTLSNDQTRQSPNQILQFTLSLY